MDRQQRMDRRQRDFEISGCYTHTHRFHVLLGLSKDIMFFILYKLYNQSPNPKPTHHRKHLVFFDFTV